MHKGPMTASPVAQHYDGANPVGCSCSLWSVNGSYLFDMRLCRDLTDDTILKNVQGWLFHWCKAFWDDRLGRWATYAIDSDVSNATRTHFMIFSECHPKAEELFLSVFRPIFQQKTRNAAHAPYYTVWNVLIAASEVDWKKMYELIKDIK